MKVAQKWDWQLAYALYMNGLAPKEILSLPEFEGMSDSVLGMRINRYGWAKARDRFQLEKSAYLSKSLQDARKSAIDSHFKFLLREVELEREVIRARVKTQKTQEQSARLEILRRYHELAEKALGIEGEKTGDAARDSDRWLIAMQVNINQNGNEKPATIGDDPASAVTILPAIKNILKKNLDAGNGISNIGCDTEISETGGNHHINGTNNHITPDEEPTADEEPTIGLYTQKLTERWTAPDATPDQILEHKRTTTNHRDEPPDELDDDQPISPDDEPIKKLGRWPKKKRP
jgi:hypothetical protein